MHSPGKLRVSNLEAEKSLALKSWPPERVSAALCVASYDRYSSSLDKENAPVQSVCILNVLPSAPVLPACSLYRPGSGSPFKCPTMRSTFLHCQCKSSIFAPSVTILSKLFLIEKLQCNIFLLNNTDINWYLHLCRRWGKVRGDKALIERSKL